MQLVTVPNKRFAPQQASLFLDETIETGIMSDCACLIILWSPKVVPKGEAYESVVGQHGGGGPSNINIEAIIDAVPAEHRGGARVFIVTGANYAAEPPYSMNNQAAKTLKTTIETGGFKDIRKIFSVNEAVVSAKGEIVSTR